MPISLITGPANAGKARVVLGKLRAHRGAGLTPILVVPTIADRDRYLRELAEQGPVSGAEVMLFSSLIDRVAHSAAGAIDRAPPIGPFARERMLAMLAAAQWPQAAGPTLGPALARTVAELASAGLTAGDLRSALGRSELAQAAEAGIATVYERYMAALRRLRRSDPDARARAALDAVREKPSLWGGVPVLMYGFDDLTALQIDAIETLGVIVDAPVTVSLSYERGRIAFDGRGFALEQLRALGASESALPARSDHYVPRSRSALHHLERSIFEVGVSRVEPAEALSLLEGGSQRAELELLAAHVRRLIDEGVDPEQIAIVHRHPRSIAEQLSEVLASNEVPHQLASSRRLLDTALGSALAGIARCGCDRAGLQVGARAGDLLAWLRCPGVLERIELADTIEERLLRGGVEDARAAIGMWEAEHWDLDRVNALAEAAGIGPHAFAERLERELLWLFAAPRRRGGEVLDPVSSEDARALRAALAALAQLADVCVAMPEAIGGVPGVLAALEEILLPPAHPAAGGFVSVSDPLSLRARRVRALFLCGMQEGVFPARTSPEPVLGDALRLRLTETLASPSFLRRQQSLAAERYLLYATLSRSEELLFVSWHAADDDGNPTPPSMFLEDIQEPFEESLWQRREYWPAGFENRRRPVPGESARGCPGPAPGSALRGRPGPAPGPALRGCAGAAPGSALRGRPGPAAPASGPALRTRPSADPVSIALRDGSVVADLESRVVWSASSLEQWAQCPMRWFVERVLRAGDLDPEPEPLARGALAHAVLLDVLEGLRRLTGSARVSASSLQSARRLMRESLHEHAEHHRLSVSKERLVLAARRLESDLSRYLEHAAGQGGWLEPTHLELAFGFEQEDGGLPAWDLGEGVRLRGRIDRIDLGQDGVAVVYDYKSGRTGADYSASKWPQNARFQMPLYMRAVQALLGREVLAGLYQPLSGDLRARGAVVTDAGLELDCVSSDRCSRDEVEEIVEEAIALARTAAAEARAGAVEARPASCLPRGGCKYPTICRCRT